MTPAPPGFTWGHTELVPRSYLAKKVRYLELTQGLPRAIASHAGPEPEHQQKASQEPKRPLETASFCPSSASFAAQLDGENVARDRRD
jgi:hypothetical protein